MYIFNFDTFKSKIFSINGELILQFGNSKKFKISKNMNQPKQY